MMLVFVRVTKIFFRLLVKSLLASERAEIICLSFVFGCASCGVGVNIHVANGIMNSGCHRLVFLFFKLYNYKDSSQRKPYYGCLHRRFCLSYFSISYPACSHATMPPSRFQIFVYPNETSSVAAISLMRPLRQYNTIFAFLSVGSWFRYSGTSI